LILQLADGSGLGESQTLGGLLHGANHGWWTTEKEFDIGGWLREEFLEAS